MKIKACGELLVKLKALLIPDASEIGILMMRGCYGFDTCGETLLKAARRGRA
jgi:hypothetical protein